MHIFWWLGYNPYKTIIQIHTENNSLKRKRAHNCPWVGISTACKIHKAYSYCSVHVSRYINLETLKTEHMLYSSLFGLFCGSRVDLVHKVGQAQHDVCITKLTIIEIAWPCFQMLKVFGYYHDFIWLQLEQELLSIRSRNFFVIFDERK